MEFSSEFHRQYQILGKLGEGGMSRVYLAVQRSLDRRVAIKFMEARAFPEQEALKRFLGEARALARLDHPNILTLFDADAEGGNPYLVLEYVEGETVRQRLERDRKLSPESAATITLFVGRGLAYAHNVKIIHRDVKPENVLLADDGGVKLLDFGLAKLAESSAQVTSHGIIVGTPAYLSPEQILGTDLTPSSDIYCLGILFYEMLTGRTPFGDANDAKSLLARTKVDLPDLTAVGDLSAPLLNVLTKCLHRDPAQRYVEIHKAVGELELLLGVSADMRIRPTRKTRPARKMETPRTTVLPRRRRVPMRLAVGLFLTAFVIGALAAIGYGLRVSAAGRVAESIDVVAGVTGLRVRWVSAEEYAGVVVATGEGGESIVAEEPAPSRRHEVLIAGLKPGRSYALDVKAGRDSVCARLRAQTAVELRLPLQARLTVEGPDQASLDLELTVPVRLEVRPSAPEVAVAVRSGESTRPHLGLSGPGAGLGMMTLTVKASTVEGTAVTQVVSLTGPGDDLAAYLSSQELGRDLVDFEETISGANLSLESRRSRAIEFLGKRKLAGQFRGFAYHLKMLTPALANPRVGLPRRMRVYELLTELWRFDRLHTLRTVKSTEFADQDVSQARASPASSAAALPATAPGTQSPLVSPRALGAAGDRGAAPSPLASADPFVPEDPLAPLGVGAAIQAFMPTEVAVRVPETVQGARALLVVHPNESNLTLSQESSTGDDYLVKGLISPDRKVQRQIAFRATMDRFTEKRIRLSIVGRCLDRRLFVDLVVNGKARLRFFCDRSAMRGVSGLDSYLNLADPVEFEDRVPRQRVSLTVPVELFHHGDNAFVLSAHPLAQVPALYSAACPPAISLVCWNPAP